MAGKKRRTKPAKKKTVRKKTKSQKTSKITKKAKSKPGKAQKKKKDYLAFVAVDKRFWLCDGGVLSNMVQLRNSLKRMSDGVFTYHVNAERNDFKNWIMDVVGDRKLAVSISKLKSSKAIYEKVAAAVRMHAKK